MYHYYYIRVYIFILRYQKLEQVEICLGVLEKDFGVLEKDSMINVNQNINIHR